ncbi:MAG: hypothetical protein ACP5VE_09970 [Chthonomonadales bacterium]
MRNAISWLAIVVLGVTAGCGSGISTVQTDTGFGGTYWGSKTITRTLENDTYAAADVDLYVNGTDYLDTIHLDPYDIVTITVDNLYADDYVYFSAVFDTGDVITGAFSQDGDTVFTLSGRSHIAAQSRNGKAEVRADGKRLALHGRHQKH